MGRDLENLARRGVNRHVDFEPPVLGRDSRRNVLHIATGALAFGGHTRTIKNWITADSDSRHSLLLTYQTEDFPVPSWVRDAVWNQGGELIVLPPSAPLLSKALWTREVWQSGADLVVLHIHQHDVVPVIAFAVDEGPPVALLNHADHVFFLGISVSDCIINLRPIGEQWTRGRRYASRNTVLPIPLTVPARG